MASITINFTNATLSSTNTSLQLTDGTYGLDVADALSVSGTVTFTSMYVTTGAISFNVASGTSFNAQVEAMVASTNAGTPPSIEVTNFTGTVTVSWPTAQGIKTEQLTSSNSLTLSGYVG